MAVGGLTGPAPWGRAVLNRLAPPTSAPQTLRLMAALLAEVSSLFWLRPVGQRPHTEHLAARRLEEGRVVVTRPADWAGETVAGATWVSGTAEGPENGLRAGPLARALDGLGDLDAPRCRDDGGPVSSCAGARDGAVWSGRPHAPPGPQLIQETDEVQAAPEASGHRLGWGVAPGDVGDTWLVRNQTGQPGGPRGSVGA